MHRSLALVLAVASMSNCGRSADSPSPTSSDTRATVTTSRPIRVLTRQTSGYGEPTELAVRDAGAWQEAWRTVHGGMPEGPAPAVDFGRETIVVAALGERHTGGYAVQVDSIATDASGTVVHYTAIAPGSGCMTIQMVTSPVDVVRVPRVEGAVRFVRREVRAAC